MSTTRASFLEQVRQALRSGNRPGEAPTIEPRGDIGYQGAGADPATTFCDQLIAAGGQPYLVGNRAGAVEKVVELVGKTTARNIVLGSGAFIDSLPLRERLRALGRAVHATPVERDRFFAADLGITGADYLVAETGTVVMLAGPSEPRSESLLPPVHIVVASVEQIVPDLFDLFNLPSLTGEGGLPSCISLITGPSKTGDIELKLVTGVHGPGEIYVVLVGK